MRWKKTPKIGLALGSGSARGWAHLGVLSVLHELDVPVHCVAGTSIGSLVGGFYAAGRLQVLADAAVNIDWKKSLYYFLEMNFPRSGLIDGKRVVDFVKEHVSDVLIEDLEIPFSAVAVDVLTGREVVISEGGLIEAIRASISIPGIFTPLARSGDVLVDGGLVNPVPVDVARGMGADVVIAVDLNHGSPGAGKKADQPGRLDLKIFDAFGNKRMSDLQRKIVSGISDKIEKMEVANMPVFKKWAAMHELPNIFDVIGNSIRIMEKEITASRLKRDKPDVLISPDLSSVGFMEFHLAEKCIFAGRAAALEKKDELLKLAKYI